MKNCDRRAFLGMSVGALSALPYPLGAQAQTPGAPACVTSGLPPFLPVRLTVDCASKRNFQLYRKNTSYLGLTGVVNMSFVRGKLGSYEAGNLFLFPWLKPKGQTLGATRFPSVCPVNATRYVSAAPIGGSTLPVDEYFCNFVLQAPAPTFIGFMVDLPYSPVEARFDWFTNIDKLADGQGGVGIDWTSSNLNNRWFGGSHFIPASDQCSGNAWRKLIIAGLTQASVGMC